MLDYKNKGDFQTSTPLRVTIKDEKKIDIQNPVAGNILSQVNSSPIGEKEVKKNYSQKLKMKKLEEDLKL